MINDIKSEAEQLAEVDICERQERYIRLNQLGSELKNIAYFVSCRA